MTEVIKPKGGHSKKLWDKLSTDIKVFVEPIVCRKGMWYFVQNGDHILSREDSLEEALSSAIEKAFC